MVARAYQPENQTEIDSPSNRDKITPQEYVRRERDAETKSEFIGGELLAMAGASFVHTRLIHSISRHLGNQLAGKPCEVVTNDIRVKINEAGDYVYPDVIVVCDGGEWEDDVFDTLLNPKIIVEVLSSSTSRRDRGDKWLLYQQMPSLQDYLMISQQEMRVEHFARQSHAWWLYAAYTTPDATVELTSINCSLSLQAIYERIQFDAPGAEIETIRDEEASTH